MQSFVCLLTSLVLAAHAVLGCGAHRPCEHRAAILADGTAAHAGHECAAHHGHSDLPCEKERDSSEPCSHSVCSFVKAETQRVDLSNDAVTSWAGSASLALSQSGTLTAAIREPVFRADITSTHLYVWHCALII
jgi:hypothetical protein